MRDSRTGTVGRTELYSVIAVLLLIDISVLHAPRGSETIEDALSALLTLGLLVAAMVAWRSRSAAPGRGASSDSPD